jgi:hypothetical protein
MITRACGNMRAGLRLFWALHAAAVLSATSPAAATQVAPGGRPTVLEADIRITMRDATACEAQVRLRVGTPAPTLLDHRVALYAGTRIADVVVSGEGVEAGTPRPSGPATEAIGIRLRPGTSSYTIAYRVTQPADRGFRCPVWLPAAPTDGLSRQVRVRVVLPAGASAAGGSLPRLAWTPAGAGEATLAQIPAIVRTPFTSAGEPSRWSESFDVTRVMDALALVALASVTGVWLWRRR